MLSCRLNQPWFFLVCFPNLLSVFVFGFVIFNHHTQIYSNSVINKNKPELSLDLWIFSSIYLLAKTTALRVACS